MNGSYLKGEYLYWHPWQDGPAFAGQGDLYPGDIKYTDFTWTSGFRALLGGHFCDNWTIEASYTYLRPKGKKTLKNGNIYPIIVPAFIVGGALVNSDRFLATFLSSNTAFSSLKLDYNVLDFEVGRNVSCFDCFDFIVLAGLQGALNNEKLEICFSGDLTAEVVSASGLSPLEQSVPAEISIVQRWKFDGGGIKVGGIGTYRTRCGFLLYGNGKFNLLFGRYTNKYQHSYTQLEELTLEGGSDIPISDYYTILGKEKFLSFVPHFQFGLGWGVEGTCGCAYYRLKAGWEMDYWFDLVRFRSGLTGNAISSSSFDTFKAPLFSSPHVTTLVPNNLGLQGLVASLEITF